VRPEELNALCDLIAEAQVRRKFFIGLVNKQTNAAKALVRRALGWKYDDEEAGREALNKRASRIVEAALSGKPQKPEDEAILGEFALALAVVGEAIDPCKKAREKIEKDMVKAVKRLPVYDSWAKNVAGLKAGMALAVIVGDAGNLSNYPGFFPEWLDKERTIPHPQAGEPRPLSMGPDTLNKRLGLAPLGGKAYSRWRIDGGLSSDEWVEAGYSPRRRAEIHSVMDPLYRTQSEWTNSTTGRVNPLGPYRAAYDRRRAHTALTHPDWKPIQSHMDGLRIMSQKLLADLWREWRRADAHLPGTAALIVPAAEEFAD
jgi:hypothetical protein